jgi:hypothetical protein
MAPRYRAALLLHLLLLGGLVLAWGPPRGVPGKDEATYLGRPTSYWEEEAMEYRFSFFSIVFSDEPPPGWEYAASWTRTRPKPFWKRCLDRLTGGPDTGDVETEDLELLSGDPDAIPVLVELLESSDSKIRQIAANGLARLGTKAGPAIPALTRALAHARKRHTFDDKAIEDALCQARYGIRKDTLSLLAFLPL